LRHCAISRKGAGLIPDTVVWIFHWRNPSGRPMAPGSTQPLTKVSIRYLPGGRNGRCVGVITLTLSCADCLEMLGASTSWSPKAVSKPVMGWLCFVMFSLSLSLRRNSPTRARAA
jgi:hypothetical protein